MAEQIDESRQPNQPTNLMEEDQYDIDLQAIRMVLNQCQFEGLPNEDPNEHLAKLSEICDIFKTNEVSKDAMCLRLFPFSLKNQAKEWLYSKPVATLTTWNDLEEKFMDRYFSIDRYLKLRNEIFTFQQREHESLYEAWERYKNMLTKCPNHGFDLGKQMFIFHYGLNEKDRRHVNASAGGTTKHKTPNQLYDLIEEIAMDEYEFNGPLKALRQQSIEISTFQQGDYEPLDEAWRRFKKMVRNCPNHGFSIGNQMIIFLCGLNDLDRFYVNVCTGGKMGHKTIRQLYKIGDKTIRQLYDLIEDMAMHQYQFSDQSRSSSQQTATISPSPSPSPSGPNKLDLDDKLAKLMSATEARFQKLESSIRNIKEQLGLIS